VFGRKLERRFQEELRRRVAREAAALLYTGQEKEYKQAKSRAAELLGVRVLPSNREVAEELDRLADEMEGPQRKRRLIEMRKDALRVMQAIEEFRPLLVGSVWRGTIHRGSDIDILVFHNDPDEVAAKIQEKGFKILRTDWQSTEKRGKRKRSFHVYVATASGNEVEIVVKDVYEADRPETCEIFDDKITGLSATQLAKVLKENPLRKFVPT